MSLADLEMASRQSGNWNVPQNTTGLNVLNETATLTVEPGMGMIGIAINGTFVLTFTFEAHVDGNWFPLGVTPAAGGAVTTTATAPGLWFIPDVSGFVAIRVRVSAVTSGSAGCQMKAGRKSN